MVAPSLGGFDHVWRFVGFGVVLGKPPSHSHV